jgi:hypothetical protein
MITKGTQQYTEAQKLANDLVKMASKERWNDNTLFKLYFDPMARFLDQVEKINGFAAQVAKTINDKMDPYGKQVAYISSKQSWIIACAAIENDIKEQYINA